MAEAKIIIKDPPILRKDSLYVNWKEKFKFGGHLSVPEEKHAPAIFMTLTGEAREVILNMDIEKLTEKTGLNNLMVELDKLYLKDESLLAYETYETFEKFVRPSGISISDYNGLSNYERSIKKGLYQ